MARVTVTLYAIDNTLVPAGDPCPGLSVSVKSLRRINTDGTSAALTPPATVHDVGAGDYWFDVDDALLLPGSIIRGVIDCSALASARYEDFELRAGEAGVATFGTVELGVEDEVILRVGDRAPSIVVTLRDASGAPVPLSSGTPVVGFFMRSDQGGALIVDNDACVIVDAAAGKVLYAWSALATTAAGNFFFELVLTQAGLQSVYPYGRRGIARVMPRV